MNNLTSLRFENDSEEMTAIGEGAFYDCTSLTSVTVLSKNAEIGEVALGYYYISRKEDGVVAGFTIYGYEGSTAESYAETDEEIAFVALEEENSECTHTGGNATCVDKAVCESCGEIYGNIDSNNHKNIVADKAVAPTCDKAGLSEGSHCEACNNTIVEQQIIPATENHDYVGVETTKATCNSTGVMTYTCSVCGDSYEEEISVDADNHAGGTEIRDAVTGNCGEAGYTGDTYCIGCNTKIANGKEIPATENHDYVGSATTSATCHTTGVMTYTCSVCGDSYEEDIPVNADNHVGGTEIRDAATGNCGEAGYTGDTYCLGCNTKIADGEEIPATENHNYVGAETTKATCNSTGVKTYTCFVLSLRVADSGELRRGTFSKCNNPL